ncbi:MAG: SidA/IucD/PvdA family monooxygenase [Flavobacteriales bacterium]
MIGIGIDSFNLGLIALLQPIEELSALFFNQTDCFDWHLGLMLDYATFTCTFHGRSVVQL